MYASFFREKKKCSDPTFIHGPERVRLSVLLTIYYCQLICSLCSYKWRQWYKSERKSSKKKKKRKAIDEKKDKGKGLERARADVGICGRRSYCGGEFIVAAGIPG